jgi:hypothetical protein
MYGLLSNMILSTKSKIYQQVLLLYVCEKITEIAIFSTAIYKNNPFILFL